LTVVYSIKHRPDFLRSSSTCPVWTGGEEKEEEGSETTFNGNRHMPFLQNSNNVNDYSIATMSIFVDDV